MSTAEPSVPPAAWTSPTPSSSSQATPLPGSSARRSSVWRAVAARSSSSSRPWISRREARLPACWAFPQRVVLPPLGLYPTCWIGWSVSWPPCQPAPRARGPSRRFTRWRSATANSSRRGTSRFSVPAASSRPWPATPASRRWQISTRSSSPPPAPPWSFAGSCTQARSTSPPRAATSRLTTSSTPTRPHARRSPHCASKRWQRAFPPTSLPTTRPRARLHDRLKSLLADRRGAGCPGRSALSLAR